MVTKYNFKTKPFAHQKDALTESWDKRSYALFMEMGTGKTKVLLDNIGALRSQNLINGALIIAPKSVYTVWYNTEIPKHLNIEYDILLWKSTMVRQKLVDFMEKPSIKLKIFVINVEAFSSDKGSFWAEEFCKRHDNLIAVDESTCVKNYQAKRTKNIIKLRKYSNYRRILSGFPTPKNPLDLYTQCNFLDPKHLGFNSIVAFRNRYCHFETLYLSGRQINVPVGFTNLAEIEAKLKNFAYRKTKKECLDLPEKIYTRRTISLSEEQRLLYDDIRTQARATLKGQELTVTNVITEILRLHQITCGYFKSREGEIQNVINKRIEALLEVCEDTDQKIIIWATYVHNIQQINRELIKKYGVDSVVTFYGDTSSDKRTEAIERFQNDPKCRFFVGNPATGGMGITLTAAGVVVYYSNSYNAEHRVQSEDRAHRIGQDQKVTYIDFVAEKTIDEKILQALDTKFKLSAKTLGEVVRDWF
jgi:SNF2 family DNA or RNA helicase